VECILKVVRKKCIIILIKVSERRVGDFRKRREDIKIDTNAPLAW